MSVSGQTKSISYLFGNKSLIDLVKNDGINRLFKRSTKPYKSIDRKTKSCEGIIAIMDHSFISSTCSRLYPTDKFIDIYIDPIRSIVYFDCGCHKDILQKQQTLHPNHNPNSFQQCYNFIQNLLNVHLLDGKTNQKIGYNSIKNSL